MKAGSSGQILAHGDDLGPALRSLLLGLEGCAVVLAIFLFCNAHVKLIVGGDPANADSPLLRAIWLPFYALGVMGLILQGRRALWAIIAAVPFLAFAALAMASTFWSIEPDISLRRGFAMMMTTLFGLYLAVRFSWRTMAELVAAGFALVAFGSIVISLAVPSLGVMADEHVGAWSGLLAEKNQLGSVMVRGTIIALFAAALAPRARAPVWLGLALVCFFLVLMTTSKTSLLALGAGLAIIVGVRLIFSAPTRAIAGVWAALCLVTLLFIVILAFPGELLQLLGRDPSLTGRTDIWAAVTPYTEARPWLGYGYQAFWANPLGPAFTIRSELDFNVQHAHNGWLETAVEQGRVGVAIMAMCIASVVLASLRRLFVWPYGACALAFVASLMVFALSEATLGEANGLITVMLVAFSVKLWLPDFNEVRASRTSAR